MGFAGYVSVCVQRYRVGFHCLSPHVSAYMAIFKCVEYFIFICLKDSASLLFFFFFFFFPRAHTLHVSVCGGGLNVRYYYLLFMQFLIVLYVCFLLTCKHMKIKYPTHFKMAMYAETCSERQ
jgi:hypothetical protein